MDSSLPGLLAATAMELMAANAPAEDRGVTAHSEGLHGYIGFGHENLPAPGGHSAGMGFYAAVWPLVDRPLADFQIGLPSSWIQPDNSDSSSPIQQALRRCGTLCSSRYQPRP